MKNIPFSDVKTGSFFIYKNEVLQVIDIRDRNFCLWVITTLGSIELSEFCNNANYIN